MCVDHCMGLMEHINLNGVTTYGSPTIAALEMNMINALMFTQTVQHKILVAIFNVAKDSEQTHSLTYNFECK